MALSVQSIGQEAEVLNDLDLLILLKMMVEEVRSRPDRYGSLGQIADHWEICWEQYGPGTLDLELETVALDSQKKIEFLYLIFIIGRKLCSLGPTLTADTVNRRWGVRGIEFFDYQTDRLHVTLDKLRALIAGSTAPSS
jgi:hypothetical protein